jgi:hypothetical protein
MVYIPVQKRNISLANVDRLLTQILEGCDKGRLDGLRRLRRIRELRRDLSALADDRDRLVLKYGPDSPQVLKYDQKVAANDLLIQKLTFEIDRRSQPILSNDIHFWQVQGFVRGESLEALGGLIVRIFNTQGNQINNPDGNWEVLTNTTGFFHLSVNPTVYIDQGCDHMEYEGQEVYLRIFSPDGITELTAEAIPLTVQTGYVEYWEICGISMTRGVSVSTFAVSAFDITTPEPGVKTISPPAESKGVWKLDGSVSGTSNVPREEMNVELYSPDEEIGSLGTASVNKDGTFTASIDPKKHPKLFEKKAEVLLKVVDKNKNELYSLKKAMKPEAGKTEKKTIKIKPRTK